MKIAINGIGVAGPTLAYWLRELGHEPVLFERAPALRTGGYLIDYWGLGYEVAERMGIIEPLLEQGYRMQRMRIVNAEGKEICGLDVAPVREQLGGRFISLARGDLAATLFRACEGIPAHFGLSIEGVEQDVDGVDVVLSDGGRQRYDLVIGADGLHSRVRELVFGPESEFEHGLGCVVATFRLHGYPHRDELAYVSHTVPGRQVARISLRNDETLVFMVFRSELVGDAPTPDTIGDTLRRVFGDMQWEVPRILQQVDSVDDIYFDRVSQIRLPRWSKGRVALLGDAAACVSLLAGEGTGLAMTEAFVLADELHRAGGDYAHAFEAFENSLRPFLADKQKGALRLRGFFAPKTSLSLFIRNWAIRLASIPLFTRSVVGASLRDDFVLPG
jgi:2-polyprenyl-6-methoxyphenol hydroxylase-like FAD-dependent oxidoreductase